MISLAHGPAHLVFLVGRALGPPRGDLAYALAAVREALDAAGITLHARGEHQRRLLQYFGPYVPIDLMVPSADAERAIEILKSVLLPRAGDEAAEEARAPQGQRATREPLPMAEKSALAGTALLAVALLAMP